MKLLGLDVGTRRTGVAFLDSDIGIPFPLTTLTHASSEDLMTLVMEIIQVRAIDRVVVGLPRLPSGDEGAQAQESRAFGELLRDRGIDVIYADERYTTPRHLSHKNVIPVSSYDGDSAAACAILANSSEI